MDTVSADKQHYEIEADNGAERRHAAVRFDAVVHDIVPVLACQYLHEQYTNGPRNVTMPARQRVMN